MPNQSKVGAVKPAAKKTAAKSAPKPKTPAKAAPPAEKPLRVVKWDFNGEAPAVRAEIFPVMDSKGVDPERLELRYANNNGGYAKTVLKAERVKKLPAWTDADDALAAKVKAKADAGKTAKPAPKGEGKAAPLSADEKKAGFIRAVLHKGARCLLHDGGKTGEYKGFKVSAGKVVIVKSSAKPGELMSADRPGIISVADAAKLPEWTGEKQFTETAPKGGAAAKTLANPKDEITVRLRLVIPTTTVTPIIKPVGNPATLGDAKKLKPEQVKAFCVERVKEKHADLVEVQYPDGKVAVWATHQDAHDALMGSPKAPEGLEKSLLPVNGNRPVIEREFWTRAPAKLRPGPEGFNYNPAAPKGEWGMTLIVGDDTGKRSGDITHLPTLSYFRFWADSDGKPTVQEAHRGDRGENR